MLTRSPMMRLGFARDVEVLTGIVCLTRGDSLDLGDMLLVSVTCSTCNFFVGPLETSNDAARYTWMPQAEQEGTRGRCWCGPEDDFVLLGGNSKGGKMNGVFGEISLRRALQDSITSVVLLIIRTSKRQE